MYRKRLLKPSSLHIFPPSLPIRVNIHVYLIELDKVYNKQRLLLSAVSDCVVVCQCEIIMQVVVISNDILSYTFSCSLPLHPAC